MKPSMMLLACVISGRAIAGSIGPDQFSAYGDGIRGNTGVANGTTVFSDSNAGWIAADRGKSIFIIAPARTAYASFYGTILAVNSPTSITLNAPVGWSYAVQRSGVGVNYYYGHDDSTAFSQAQRAVAAGVNKTGYSANYNIYDKVDCLVLTSPKIYMVTQPQVIGGPPTTTAPCWKSDGGMATVALGNIAAGSEAVTFGGGSASGEPPPAYARIEGIMFDCTFSGNDCLSWRGFQNPTIRNVRIYDAAHDCLQINPGGGTWIQQGHVESLILANCGNDGIAISVGTGSFANETDFSNLVAGEVSVRRAGGTAFEVASMGLIVDAWAITNWKFTEGWDGNPDYQPSPHCVVIGGPGAFGTIGLQLNSGYCEEDPRHVLGATSSPIYVNPSSTALLYVKGFYASNWGHDISHAPFNGEGYLSVRGLTEVDLYTTSQYYGYSGQCWLQMNDGLRATMESFTVVGTGNAAPTVGNVVTSSYPSAVSYTLTGENFSGVQHLTLKNTGTPTITATFACQNLQQTAPPHFTWNQ